MVVHPAAGNYTGTLVNALLYHCGDSLSGINGEIRPGIVHRIDKDTSGLLIVAKNDTAHRHLAEQIKAHSFTREYEAIVYERDILGLGAGGYRVRQGDDDTVTLPQGVLLPCRSAVFQDTSLFRQRLYLAAGKLRHQ